MLISIETEQSLLQATTLAAKKPEYATAFLLMLADSLVRAGHSYEDVSTLYENVATLLQDFIS
jgi:hypothetical protein